MRLNRGLERLNLSFKFLIKPLMFFWHTSINLKGGTFQRLIWTRQVEGDIDNFVGFHKLLT